MKRLAVFLAASAAGVGLAQVATTQAEKGKTEVKVAGLIVFPADPNGRAAESQLAGTSVCFLITDEGRHFVSLDGEASKLLAFGDDKGTDLSESRGRGFGLGWVGGAITRIGGPHSCTFCISSTKAPAAGARELKVKASVVILCGADEKKAGQKNVELKEGAKLNIGSLPVEIADVKEWPHAKGFYMIGLRSEKHLGAIQKLSFLGPDGKEMEARDMGTGERTKGDKTTYVRTCLLKGRPDKVTIEATYFDRLEKLEIPIDATVGVGF